MNGVVVNDTKYFFSSRVQPEQYHGISVEQFKIYIDKEPGQVFLNKFHKKKELMKDKMFLNLTLVEKLLDDIGVPQATAMTLILDSTYGFESEKEKDKLRYVVGKLHTPIMDFHSSGIKSQKIPRRTPAE